MKDVVGKVAFITGGASGMGLAIARSFTAAGMKVVIADVEQAALNAVQDEFADTNASVLCLRVDVTDRAAMTAAAEDCVAHFGKVHVVVNNAGVAVGGANKHNSPELTIASGIVSETIAELDETIQEDESRTRQRSIHIRL